MVSTRESSTNEPQSKSSETPQDGAERLRKPLDVVFLQDTTGSQGPYIVAARKAIRDICAKISSSADLSQNLLRFGLIAFRDHPPMDTSYVTKSKGFTSDVVVMEKNLASLIASGGGDGPEAQTAALAEALNTDWADGATRIVILITDSPPHGLGERGDHFDKSPDQNDPLEIARQMAEHGITLFVIACEPTLSNSYMNALDFYGAITDITGGRVLPLMMADKLGEYIVGTVVETIETESLIAEFEQMIVDDVYNKSRPMESVAQNLQQFIADRGVKITTMNVEDIYHRSDIAARNRTAWAGAATLGLARGSIQPVHGPRIQQQYMQSAAMSSYPVYIASGGPLLTASRTRGLCLRGGRGGGRGGGLGRGGALSGLGASSVAMGGATRQQVQQVQQMRQMQQMQQQVALSAAVPGAASAEGPAVSYGKATISQQQAARIVQQSVTRNSKVTPTGYVSKLSGRSVPSMNSGGPL